jgi:hypothetical protein
MKAMADFVTAAATMTRIGGQKLLVGRSFERTSN